MTPSLARRKIPAIAVHLAAGGIPYWESGRRRTRACNICPAGPCNASIRSALPVDIGSALIFRDLTPASNSVRVAAARFKPFRRRSARACGCVRVHSPRARLCVLAHADNAQLATFVSAARSMLRNPCRLQVHLKSQVKSQKSLMKTRKTGSSSSRTTFSKPGRKTAAWCC